MKKVYIFMADGTEEVEALTVVDLLRRAGIDVSIVSVMGRKQIVSSHKVKIEADFLIEEVAGTLADMLVLPGGLPGTDHLRENEQLAHMLLGQYQAGSYIAAICAAPSVLAGLHLLDGKKATSYPGFLDGYDQVNVVKEEVVQDGNVITSRGLGTAIPFALQLIANLTDEKTAKETAEKIIFRA